MPTVLEVGGFTMTIYLPPREHGPPHVHVRRAGAEVVIGLGAELTVIRNAGLRAQDIRRALAIVADNADLLTAEWRKYHG